MSNKIKRSIAEWKASWPIVLASFVGIALCLSPLPYYAAITIGPEFGKEFGWSRVDIQSGFMFMTAGVLIGAPIAGGLTDRFGTRRVLLPSILALGVMTAAFGLMNANPIIYFSIFYLVAVLGAGTLPLTWSKAIVNNFKDSRGLALGIALTGTGIYGLLAPPFIRSVIDAGGWRLAYLCVGLMPILMSFPLAYFIFRDAKEDIAMREVASEAAMPDVMDSEAMSKTADPQMGGVLAWVTPIAMIIGVYVVIVTALEMIGIVPTTGLMLLILLGLIYYELRKESGMQFVDLPGLTLGEALRGYRFWVILTAFFVLGACISGIIANTIFILLDKGYSLQLASSPTAGLGLIGASVIAGRLIGGLVVDHVWAPLVGFVFLGIPALGCFILMQDLPQIYNSIAIILVGVAAGVEFDLMAIFVSHYIGMRAYSRVYSFIYAAFGIGSGTAPALFNALRGEAINYNSVLSYAMVGFVVGAVILLTLGKYQDFQSLSETES